jgi:hypothetical protein
MLTAKLFAGLASMLALSAILTRLHSSAPVPIYLQLIAALSCVIFAAVFFVAELWIRPPLNQTIGLVQCGFVGISVCTFIFEFVRNFANAKYTSRLTRLSESGFGTLNRCAFTSG